MSGGERVNPEQRMRKCLYCEDGSVPNPHPCNGSTQSLQYENTAVRGSPINLGYN